MQERSSEREVRFAVRGERRNGIHRLSLVGQLDPSSVPMLEGELDDVAHPGGAIILDLSDLDSVDPSGVLALEGLAQHADRGGWWLFIANCRRHVRDAFERAGIGGLLTTTDVWDVLASGDGRWSPISLPPLRGSGQGEGRSA